MRIKILKKLPKGKGYPHWPIGKEVDVTQDFGKQLIKEKLAEEVHGPNPDVKIMQRHFAEKEK